MQSTKGKLTTLIAMTPPMPGASWSMPPWVVDAHFLEPQRSITVLALEDERDQRRLVLELDVAHHAARALARQDV
ncbi:uncharacterized protein PY1_contig-05-143 [Novosphingobium sp. PY1]|nr:uncharacterized protein PY1_contig-05-143 [Novosphingobium sp. PY1]